jgi:acetoin utilization protein AcuC
MDERMLAYHLGSSHSMNPKRIFPAYHLLNELFIDLTDTEFELVIPSGLDREYLYKAHDQEYIETFEELSRTGSGQALKYGLGSPDCPVWAGMAETSEFIVSSTMHAAEQIYNGILNYTFVLLGGLHHARTARASGFCYYNDINVTIHRLKALNPDIRIFYVDTDVHHGDGVQFDFYNDPNVLKISFHESGRYLFPGTGFSDEIGSGPGKGYAINLPFHPYIWDDLYLGNFEKYIPALFESYQPDFVIWQAGVDGHAKDPLGHLLLTSNTYNRIASTIRELSQNNMDTPKVLAMGGGGYNPDSVARSWANIVSGLSGCKLPETASDNWLKLCRSQQIDVNSNLAEEITVPFSNEHKVIAGMATREYIDEFERILVDYHSI